MSIKKLLIKLSHNEYRDFLLNMYKTFSDYDWTQKSRKATCEIKNISMSCFDEKVYILGNVIDMLALST